MNISSQDKAILREVASRYMEYAALPIHELNGEGDYNGQVSDPFFRYIEFEMRHKMYMWKHFPVDMAAGLHHAVRDLGLAVSVDGRRNHSERHQHGTVSAGTSGALGGNRNERSEKVANNDTWVCIMNIS